MIDSFEAVGPWNELLSPPQEVCYGDLLLTPAEAAKALSISERTLWTFTRSNQIPAVHIGRSVRYCPDSLREWITQKEQHGQHQLGS